MMDFMQALGKCKEGAVIYRLGWECTRSAIAESAGELVLVDVESRIVDMFIPRLCVDDIQACDWVVV